LDPDFVYDLQGPGLGLFVLPDQKANLALIKVRQIQISADIYSANRSPS
jgi:hypothetical protein